MKRGGPLKRGPGPKRKAWLSLRKRLNPVTKDKSKRDARWERQYGDQARLAWTKPCLVLVAGGAGCWGPVEAAHVVRTRGAGGTSEHIAPLCRGHHQEQESSPNSAFEAKHGVDLVAEAARLAEEVRRGQ